MSIREEGVVKVLGYAIVGLFFLLLLAFIALLVIGSIRDAARSETTRWIFIDPDGRQAFAGQFEEARPFYNGRAAVKVGGTWGYIDTSGRLVVPPRFFLAGDVSSEGIAPVTEGGRWGYIRADGSWLVPPSFTDAQPFMEGLGVVSREVSVRVSAISQSRMTEASGLVDAGGAVVWAPDADDSGLRRSIWYGFSDGLAPAKDQALGKFGWVGRDGGWAIAPAYDHTEHFREGLAAAKQDEAWGYVDRSGAVAIPFRFANASPFSEGMAVVSMGDRDIFIGRGGEPVNAASFRWALPFSGGLAAAEENRRWGFVDPAGQWQIPPRYRKVGAYGRLAGDGAWYAAVGEGDSLDDLRWGFIDRDGTPVIPPRFLEVNHAGFSDGLCAVRVERDDVKP